MLDNNWFFMNYFDWVRTFDGYYLLFFECDNINFIHLLNYYFVPINFYYFLNVSFHRNFPDDFNRNFSLFLFNAGYRYLLNNINRFFNIEIMMSLFIVGLRNGDRNNDLLFGRYFNYCLFNDLFLNYSVDKLRNFHNNFNYPWNRYYFLNYNLYWFYNGHFYYFVDDFVYSYWNFLYYIFCHCYGHYFLSLTVDDFGFGHYYRHFFFVDLWDVFGYHLFLDAFNGDQMGYGHLFNQRFLNNQFNWFYHLLTIGNRYSFFHYIYLLFDRDRNHNINSFLNLFDFSLVDNNGFRWHRYFNNFFNNLSNQNRNFNSFLNLFYFGYDGRYFNNFCFFNDNLFDSIFEDGFIFFSNVVFSFNDRFLNYFFNFYYFSFNSRFQNDLVDESWNWYLFFFNSFFNY